MKRRRVGISLVEVAIAIVVLASATLVLTQLLGSVASQRRAAAQQQIAADTAANTLELALTAPYDASSPAEQTLELPTEVKDALHEATCRLQTIAVAAAEGGPAGQRLIVTVSWRAGVGGIPHNVTLCGWKFTPQEAAP